MMRRGRAVVGPRGHRGWAAMGMAAALIAGSPLDPLSGLLAVAAFEPEAPHQPATRLATATAAHRNVTLSGFTRPRAEVALVAETPGRVLEVLHDIGEAIGPDGRFAQLDDTFIRLDLEEVRVQQDQLRAQIDYDQREVKRYRELARQSNASVSQLDTLEQALRNNGHALRGLDVRERMLSERLARATVTAPPGWRVTARMVEPGQWVREGETIGRAADFSTLLAPFALTPEQFAALGAQGDSLHLALPDQGRKLGARIYRSNPGFDPETRKIALDLALTDPLEPARGGLRVELTLRLPERTGAVSLPREAVERSYEEHWVTRDNGERLRVLLLGPDGDDPDRVRVAAPGLEPGDRLRLPPAASPET